MNSINKINYCLNKKKSNKVIYMLSNEMRDYKNKKNK